MGTIPKVVHRIWLDDPVPAEFTAYGDMWRRLHPSWKIIDWLHSGDVPALRNQSLFDRARDILPRDWKRFQADLLRLELLDQFGGVYADCDVQPLRPIDDLVGCAAFVAFSPNRYHGRRLLTQAVLGAVAGHPWISACIDGIPEATRVFERRPLAQMIGPHHISRVFDRGNWPDVVVYDESKFYPQSCADRDAGRPVDLSNAYLHHKWATSRAKTAAARQRRQPGRQPPRP